MGGENIPVKATLSYPKWTGAYIKIFKKEVVIMTTIEKEKKILTLLKEE